MMMTMICAGSKKITVGPWEWDQYPTELQAETDNKLDCKWPHNYSMCGTYSTEQMCLSHNTYEKHVLWRHSLTVVLKKDQQQQQHCVKQYTVQWTNTE